MSADEHLRHWLAKGMTGCQFAKLIAQKKDRSVTFIFTGVAPEEDVSRLFEAGTRSHLPAIAIFTAIRTEDALVEQLGVLGRSPRWKITREHPDGLVTDDVMDGLSTECGDRSRAQYRLVATSAVTPDRASVCRALGVTA